ncbi:CocE/NonD family hydrolase [Prosthecobacter sp.]|uniref:CocE/NonD family hydrolase n=1 Tax=Prosthecobacter sp. TaxID=1965333 RepID=UPI002487912C|nr:CocE/NonD family hydrolase [Prosthecobacter sp.]MDI1313064.1 CocE/NonD family hydrolase [Prosthecobacter sp.]
MRHALLFLAACVSLNAAAAPPKLDFGSVREEHIMIPMRDGKRLSAYVFFPKGEGKWPAIFEQRYADISSAGSRKAAAKFAEGGFVIALVNYRGTHESEGVYRGYRGLQWGPLRDGYDVCEWLATQPWCTGKIGTYGGSQAGYAQNYLAVTQPPHLVAQYMTDTGLSLYQEGYRIGGATKPQRFIKGGSVARDPKDNEAMLREWDQHPDYDDFWKDEDASLHFDKMNYPCFTIGSWFDFMCQGSVDSFIGRQQHGGANSRGQQQLIIGPWLHGGYPKSNKIGELLFPENAKFDVYPHMTKWFNHYLKGEANGVEKDTTVKYYVMGAAGEEGAPGNVWREAKDFPPASSTADWFLQPDGKLAAAKPSAAKASTAYASDPAHPMSLPYAGFPGAKDARGFEEQAEVRTWTSEVLTQPLEVTGRIKAEVFVSSTAKDTDFFLRVTDVYPDGRSILLVDYPLRARYHEGFDHQKLLVPDAVTKLAWDIGWTSIIFNKGHRIRITIASTGAPYYEPNPQTGAPISHFITEPGVAAINTIWHDQTHASRVILPVIK